MYGQARFRPGALYGKARRKTYELFSPSKGGKVGFYIDAGIMILIVASVVAVILETVDYFSANFGGFFYGFEVVATAIFTIEYVGRLWAAVEDGEYQSPVFGRLKFARQPLVIIDLVAILPFYLSFVGIGVDLRFLRALRLVRLLRLLKLARYSESLQAFGHVIRSKKEELAVAFGSNAMLLVLASSTMYYVEHGAQPDAFSSIPATMWWGIATLTTVGYGDVAPVTPTGRALGGLIALIGIGLFALPAAVLASGFMDVIEDNDNSEYSHCPHCGESLDD